MRGRKNLGCKTTSQLIFMLRNLSKQNVVARRSYEVYDLCAAQKKTCKKAIKKENRSGLPRSYHK